MKRRHLLLGSAVTDAGILAAPSLSKAQANWPRRPATIVAPFACCRGRSAIQSPAGGGLPATSAKRRGPQIIMK